MATLSRDLRRELERVIIQARRVGEEGAIKALEQLAVANDKPWPSMTEEQKRLRVRLRAHGRQLGDKIDARGAQSTRRLAQECAYEHWHRMLFARFLAESNLLIEPESGVAISLDECRELARQQGKDWLVLASEFAVRMLPQIFRAGDPVLEVPLPPETRHELEQLLKALPVDSFAADDSLGWVYQFWQAERKDEVNNSGDKIGADELPAVTQLFTEDYMVLFLLHNTLGAWWTAKRRAEGREPAVPGYVWTYLRLKDDGSPAAGSFEGWPRAARDLKILDPCMGSGHFLIFALPILAAFRMEEEGLPREQAVEAVLRDNLFGLEIENRCTQIAAFNLALTAWRMIGSVRELPPLNLACSGLGINAKEEDWLKLAGRDDRSRETMKRLYDLFVQAPSLGSLISPKRVGGTLLAATFEEVQSVLMRALTAERNDDAEAELAVTAQGILKAAQILADNFNLVVTNVPYLGRGKQAVELCLHADRFYPKSKTDLGTCFVERSLEFCVTGGSIGLVTPQGWLYQARYRALREALLKSETWDFVATLGAKAFQTPMWDFNVMLLGITKSFPESGHSFLGIDASEYRTPEEKQLGVRNDEQVKINQASQIKNPDARISLEHLSAKTLLAQYASCIQGLATSDDPQFTCFFWEFGRIGDGWEGLLGTVERTTDYGGRERLIHWDKGSGRYFRHAQALKAEGRLGGWKSGTEARGKTGILVSQMSAMPVTIYKGEFYDHNASVIISPDPSILPAIWSFASDPSFTREVRKLDQSLKPSNNVFVKVPFDLSYWQQIANVALPDGLPNPYSNDPTQWLFQGAPTGSEQSLHVAIARLVDYRWPRQTGSSFMDCPALGPDGLEKHADADGIVCLTSLQGERPAANRLSALLSGAFGSEWSAAKQNELLTQVGYSGKSLEEWLRDGFFEQHCELFHQRPFIWHIWDGLRDGFHALVNYHKLAAPNGAGRQTLQKLTYSYLGDWIERQRADQKNGVDGADGRLAAALQLKKELEKILEGEPPYDIFVRWKPLYEQPLGWDPDINDGVRINIRPFMTAKTIKSNKNGGILRIAPKIKWEKDRGNEPHRPKEESPWFWKWDGKTKDFSGGHEFDGNRWNDLHYSLEKKKEGRERHAERKQGKKPQGVSR